MLRHAPKLECSAEDRASLVAMTKSQTAEARAVERARIILASLEGKEIQPVGRELKLSVPTISKWRQRFSLWGLRGLRDQHGRENRSGMTPHFATGCWPRWRRHRLPACPIGTDRRWRRNSTPAFTPSGAFCEAKASTSKGGAAGA
jgi:hypothetical protein